MTLGGEPPCFAEQVGYFERDLDSREAIAELVVDFYRLVATDDLLGPIFAAAHVDWVADVEKLTDFWAWQLLGQRGYEGNPLRAHAPLHAATPFGPEHFERWLDLFESTLDEGFGGPAAELAKLRARRMARALARLLDGEVASRDPSVDTEPVEVLWVRELPQGPR